MNWEQLKTIIWLRWRLSSNQWKKSGGLGGAIAAIIAVGAVALSLISFVGALLIGALAMNKAPAMGVMGVWLGVSIVFLFFWAIGVIAELQRSEIIDLRRLLHLPVGLGQIFCVNYVASHFALSIILLGPAMLGLSLGFTISRGFLMILLAPLAMSFVFMLTAWTYCLRGWLAGLMGQTRTFLDLVWFYTDQDPTALAPLPIAYTPTAVIYGLLGAALALLALLVPALGASRYTIVTFKWERARALLRPFWQRYYLDFLLLLPSLP